MVLTPEGYRPRIVESRLDDMLRTFGAVCLEGPRFCGKTWLSRSRSNSEISLDDPTGNYAKRERVKMDIYSAFAGDAPHLIDEWQEIPAIWDATKFVVDEGVGSGRFILAGSSTPTYKGVMNSVAGRIGKMTIRTMSLYESGESSGEVSLQSLFDGSFKICLCESSLDKLIRATVRGGWPGNLDLDVESSFVNGTYLRRILSDAVHLDGKHRDLRKMECLVGALARNESKIVSKTKLMQDVADYYHETISDKTMDEYLDVLRRTFILNDQRPFNPVYKTHVRVGNQVKHRLSDPSLGIAILDLDYDQLLNDPSTFSRFFEALVVRDLEIYASCLDAKICHYHDDKRRVIDAVVRFSDGRWGAFDIRLGAHQIDSAAESLIKIRGYMADRGARIPEFLCVICGLSQAAYCREDGVYVVPITALKP